MQSIELKPGQVIELELEKSKDEILQFRTLIEEYDGDTEFTLLAPMYRSMPYPFRDEEIVDVIYTVHDEENKPHAFTFKAKTDKRYRQGQLTYLKIIRTSEVTKLQRRGFYRLSYVADMTFEVLDEAGEVTPVEPHTIVTKDISAGGVRGIVTAKLPVGTRIRLHLVLGGDEMTLESRVISSRRVEDSAIRYEIRGAFFGLNAKETGHLIQVINQMQSEYIRRMSAVSLEERLATYGHDELLFSERRVKRDWVLKWLDWSVVLTWLLTFVVVIIFLLAMPEMPNTIDRYYGYPVRLEWDLSLVQKNVYFLLALFVLTSISIILNATRLKRADDHYRPTLIVMGIISLILIMVYILFF